MVILSKKKYQQLTKRVDDLQEKVAMVIHELYSRTDEKKSVVFEVLKAQKKIIDENQPIIDRARLAMGISELEASKDKQDIYDEWINGENKKVKDNG